MDKFPAELKGLPQWVVWRMETREGKDTKVPYTITDRRASTTEPRDWTTFENAKKCNDDSFDYSGIGFCFAPPIVGIDLDKCRDASTGKVEPWASKAIKMLDSYTEISQSGKGFHIIVRGKMPEGGNRKGPVEMYTRGRYFVATGNHVEGTPLEIHECDLTAFHKKYIVNGTTQLVSNVQLDESKEEFKAALNIIDRIGTDIDEVEAEFRRTVKHRPKHDEKRGAVTWLRYTIENAIKHARANPSPKLKALLVADAGIDVPFVEDPIPEFPQISGSIADLCSVLAPDIPYAFKTMAAITRIGLSLSDKVFLHGEPWLQPRFYTVLIGKRWTGKGAAISETKKLDRGVDLYTVISGSTEILSADSGPALIDSFEEISTTPRRILLVSDEISGLFEKGKSAKDSRNTLLKEFLTLFDQNATGNRTRSQGVVEIRDAHLAILGGVQPEVYEQMWTGTQGAIGGLQSRFTLVTTAGGTIPARQRPSDEVAVQEILWRMKNQVESKVARQIDLSPQAERLLTEWWEAKDKASDLAARVPDMVKRLLMVLAITNDVAVVSPELVQQGLAFGDYQIRLREMFNPADSYSWTQAFEQAIVGALSRNLAPLSKRDLTRATNAAKKPGGYGAFNQALRNLNDAGRVRKVGSNRKKADLFGLG